MLKKIHVNFSTMLNISGNKKYIKKSNARRKLREKKQEGLLMRDLQRKRRKDRSNKKIGRRSYLTRRRGSKR
jgi:hypothetical protein